MGWEGVDWIKLAQDKGFVNARLDWLSDCYLLKKDPAPCG